ncbi:MAG: hypothetical protein IJA19_05030, partial [Clostridia bacterium]|nr:hypothetical protein [Clostridia bacterium]
KVATKADGSFLVRADSGLGYTAYSKDNVCLGGVNTDDEEEAKRKFNYGELDESILSISDLRRYYETSTSIDKQKYPNFPTWYNYMVRSGKYKVEKLVPTTKQIRESVQLTEEEKVLQLAVALLWEMDNFVMSVYDNEGWLMNGPGDGEFDEDTYEEAYNNYEDHTWLITDIDTGLFCASDFADFIDTFESCTSSRRDYDQEERNKIITTAKTLLGHQPTVTEDIEDPDFSDDEEPKGFWRVKSDWDSKDFDDEEEAYAIYQDWCDNADEQDEISIYYVDETGYEELLDNHFEYGDKVDRAYDDYVDRMLFDESLTEEDEADFDEPDTADQQYTSARTSINSSKLPAIFKMVNFEPGTVNLDIGGGKFDNAAEALAQNNVTNLVWDPYNRSNEHNRSVLTQVKKNGGADTVTNSNVLNVIQEPEARLAVIRNCHKYLKNGGTAYFTVYEGSGSGEGGVTKSGYQLNKKTTDYVEEISQVFGNVTRKGKLIIAKK